MALPRAGNKFVRSFALCKRMAALYSRGAVSLA
jgi:hypothetical protein